jgi:hypothetical protein
MIPCSAAYRSKSASHERADVQFEAQLPIFIDALKGTANGTHDQPREPKGVLTGNDQCVIAAPSSTNLRTQRVSVALHGLCAQERFAEEPHLPASPPQLSAHRLAERSGMCVQRVTLIHSSPPHVTARHLFGLA